MNWRHHALSVAAAFTIAVSSGCNTGGAPYQPVENDLRALGMLYGSYRRDHAGKSATSDQEFKDYAASLPEETLDKLQVDDVDRLFISSRDGKSYVILYGNAAKNNPAGVIAHEQEGKDGKRWVVDRLGVVTEVDEASFKQMMTGGK